jgi:hypothetical protein
MTIIGTFPTTIANGQVEDATVVMSLFAWIQSQTNGNACAATTGSTVLKGDGAGNTTAAVAGTDYSAGTQSLATGILKSTTGTGALTTAAAADVNAALGYTAAPTASPTFTGTVTAPTFAGALTGNASTASALSAASSIPNLTAATTQGVADNSGYLATTGFVKSTLLGGPNQGWSTGGITSGTSYPNNTGRPIFISVSIQGSSASGNIVVGGVTVASGANGASGPSVQLYAVCPTGQSYQVNVTAGSFALTATLA